MLSGDDPFLGDMFFLLVGMVFLLAGICMRDLKNVLKTQFSSVVSQVDSVSLSLVVSCFHCQPAADDADTFDSEADDKDETSMVHLTGVPGLV